MAIKIYELKTETAYFRPLLDRKKNFEIRKNDRGFRVGDWLKLREIYENGRYSGREVLREITYVFSDEEYGLKDGYCVLGLK